MFSFSFLPDVVLLYSGYSGQNIVNFYKKALLPGEPEEFTGSANGFLP